MTRQIKKSLLASAVAIAMGAGASVATADAILFPYLSKGAEVTTLVTVINQADVDELHYMYHYKTPVAGETEAAQNLRACVHANYYQPSSKNDIVTFDVGGVLGDDNNVLWDDPGAGKNPPLGLQRPYDGPFSIGVPAWAGYLIVNSDVSAADLSLSGEAMSFDWGAGAAWGYEAYNPKGVDAGDFSSSVARNGEVLVKDGYRSPIDLVPMAGENVNLVERLYVTPTNGPDPKLGMDSNVNLAARIQIGVPESQGYMVYDRNEKEYSVVVAPRVVCVGRVTLTAPGFWVPGAQNHLKNGGWTLIDPVAFGTISNEDPNQFAKVEEAIVQKLEYNTNAVGLAGDGIYNTAVWLRDMD